MDRIIFSGLILLCFLAGTIGTVIVILTPKPPAQIVKAEIISHDEFLRYAKYHCDKYKANPERNNGYAVYCEYYEELKKGEK